MATIQLERRRRLRAEATDAEAFMWRLLRERRLYDHKFRRQHSVGPYILDFFCAKRSLAVELDGGQHFLPEGHDYDEKRTRYLREKGVRVLRFDNGVVFRETEAVLEDILRALGSL